MPGRGLCNELAPHAGPRLMLLCCVAYIPGLYVRLCIPTRRHVVGTQGCIAMNPCRVPLTKRCDKCEHRGQVGPTDQRQCCLGLVHVPSYKLWWRFTATAAHWQQGSPCGLHPLWSSTDLFALADTHASGCQLPTRRRLQLHCRWCWQMVLHGSSLVQQRHPPAKGMPTAGVFGCSG